MAKLNLTQQVRERTGTQDAGEVRVMDIPIGDIEVKQNVRASDAIDIDDLIASIEQVGLLQPITVYKSDDGYTCIVGHRRLRAYRELHKVNKDRFHSIRAIITDDENITVRQLIENIQRSDLKPEELYHGLKELRDAGMQIKQIAAVIGKAEGYVKNMFTAIKELESDPENIAIFQKSPQVTLSDFQRLAGVEDRKTKRKLLQDRANGKITQKQLEQKVAAKRKPTRKVELHTDAKGLFIEITADDKDTYALISRELKTLFQRLNITIKGR
mgnify:CR=1 FL=1